MWWDFGDTEDFSAVLVTSWHTLDGKQYSWAFPTGSSFKDDFKSSRYPKKLSVHLEFDTTSIATYRKAEFCDFSFDQLILTPSFLICEEKHWMQATRWKIVVQCLIKSMVCT